MNSIFKRKKKTTERIRKNKQKNPERIKKNRPQRWAWRTKMTKILQAK